MPTTSGIQSSRAGGLGPVDCCLKPLPSAFRSRYLPVTGMNWRAHLRLAEQ